VQIGLGLLLLLRLRQIAPADVAPDTPPFHWDPISVNSIPNLVVVIRAYVCLICRNFSQNPKRRSRTGPKFQSVIRFHIDDACFYKLIRMKKLSAIRPFYFSRSHSFYFLLPCPPNWGRFIAICISFFRIDFAAGALNSEASRSSSGKCISSNMRPFF
jgi:hypothetical protein